MLHIPIVHAHDVSKQIPQEKNFLTPRATLTHLSCSPNFPRASYLDERTLTYEPIVNLQAIFTLASGILRRIQRREMVSRFWFIIERFIQIHPIHTKGKTCFKAVLLNTV